MPMSAMSMSGRHSSQAANASGAETAVRTTAPPCASIIVTSSRASASSSTISTRTPESEGGFWVVNLQPAASSRNSSGDAARAGGATGSVTVNVAPLPSPSLAGGTPPAVHSDYGPPEGEPQPNPPLRAARPAVLLPEAVEDIWKNLRFDPLPVVGDGDLDM